MHVILSDFRGERQEGLVLTASWSRLRVALRNSNDTVELHREFGQWLSESGEPVEFEGLTTDDDFNLGRLYSEAFPRTFAAASEHGFD